MNQEQLYELINNIPVTSENAGIIEEIKIDLERRDYTAVLQKIEMLRDQKVKNPTQKETEQEEYDEYEEEDDENITGMFRKELRDRKL